jgi:hypothetical protein
VSDDEVWEIVKKIRKARRKQLQRENGLIHRTISWLVGNRNSDNNHNSDDDEDNQNFQEPETVQSELRLSDEPRLESILGSTDIESGSASDEEEDDDDDDDDGPTSSGSDRSAQTPAENIGESKNEWADRCLQTPSIDSCPDGARADEKLGRGSTSDESDGDCDVGGGRPEPHGAEEDEEERPGADRTSDESDHDSPEEVGGSASESMEESRKGSCNDEARPASDISDAPLQCCEEASMQETASPSESLANCSEM